MESLSDILHGQPEANRQRRFLNDLARFVSQHMSAQQTPRDLFGDQLDQQLQRR